MLKAIHVVHQQATGASFTFWFELKSRFDTVVFLLQAVKYSHKCHKIISRWIYDVIKAMELPPIKCTDQKCSTRRKRNFLQTFIFAIFYFTSNKQINVLISSTIELKKRLNFTFEPFHVSQQGTAHSTRVNRQKGRWWHVVKSSSSHKHSGWEESSATTKQK
jgi:hypothetical protein